MSAVVALARQEWRTSFASPLGWALVAGNAALAAWWLLGGLDAWMAEQAERALVAGGAGLTRLVVAPYHATLALWLIALVPLVTMRAVCGERRAGTLALIFASGTGDAQIALGKYFGAYGVVLATLAIPLALPLAFALGTDLDEGLVVSGTLGVLLSAALLTALGLAASAFAQHPASAAVVALGGGALLCLVDGAARARGELGGLAVYLALPTHLSPLLRGIVAAIDVVYFLAFATALLVITARRLMRLRERG